MTDVRLTALNPTDSQVYPVACNTSGELLVAGDGTDYLPLTGGDLTGDLTLGTDKITLEASSGSGTFAGNVTVTNNVTVDNNVRVNNNLGVYAAGGNIYEGYSTSSGSSVITFSVNADGSGTFAGTVQTDSWFQSDRTAASGSVLYGRLNGVANVNITADGNASFSGTVTATSISSGGTITAAGSGTFGGGVISNSTYAGGSGSYGCKLLSEGVIQACASGDVWQGYDLGNAAKTSSITATGNASFSGTVTATNVSPSDARFKENITPAKPQLADVVALGGILKNYDWNDEAPVNDEIRAQRQLGLIAQEAAEICPDLVKELRSEENRYKGIPMEALIMKLIGAVSELKNELDQMKIT